MAEETVNAQFTHVDENTKDKTVVDVSAKFDFGEDINDMINMFGAETAFHQAKSSLKVAFQGFLRVLAAKGETQEGIDAEVANWTPPSGKPRGKSKLERAKELIAKLSDEDREALLAG